MKSLKKFINESQFIIGKNNKDEVLTNYNAIYMIIPDTSVVFSAVKTHDIDEFISNTQSNGLELTEEAGDIIEYEYFGFTNKTVLAHVSLSAEDNEMVTNMHTYIAYSKDGKNIMGMSNDGKNFKSTREILNSEEDDILLVYFNINSDNISVKTVDTE